MNLEEILFKRQKKASAQDSQESITVVDTKTAELLIGLKSIQLDYSDKQGFQHPTEPFLDEQIGLHEHYKEALRKGRSALMKENAEDYEMISEIDRILELDVWGVGVPLLRIMGLCANIFAFCVEGKNFREILRDYAETRNSEARDYQLCKETVYSGIELMDKSLHENSLLPPNLKQKYERLVALAKDISFMFSDSINRVNERGNIVNRVQILLYGEPIVFDEKYLSSTSFK